MLRDYEIPLLEVQEDKYKNNIPLATSFVKDFLEEYKKLKKLLANDEESSAEEMFEEYCVNIYKDRKKVEVNFNNDSLLVRENLDTKVYIEY